LVYDSDGSGTMLTNTVVSAVSVASTTTAVVTAVSPVVTELGRKLYASAGNVVLTFTPNAEDDLMDNTAGRVRVFLRLHDRK